MDLPRDIPLQVHLFGALELSYDRQPAVPMASRASRLLLAKLLLEAGTPQSRSRLGHLLWPDVSEFRGRRRLSNALWQLQDVLAELNSPHSYVAADRDTITFNSQVPYWLDVEEFTTRLNEADAAGSVQKLMDSGGLQHLRRCVELYRGDLLTASYDDWVVEERGRLQQRYTAALTRLIKVSKHLGNYEEALAAARRLLTIDPLQESAHRQVMQLLAVLGRVDEARTQYDRLTSILKTELGVEPSGELQELYRRLTANAPAPAAPHTPQLDRLGLVGRTEERQLLLQQIDRTFGSRPKPVVIEGEPGVGKSRLLQQVVDDAQWRDVRCLWGACTGGDVPYAPLRQALHAAVQGVLITQLQATVDAVWLQQAARLLPQLQLGPHKPEVRRHRAGHAVLQAGDAAVRLRQALVEVLLALARLQPTMLVVEDLHEADPATLEVLQDLGRRTDRGNLLLVVSFRSAAGRTEDDVWKTLRTLDRDTHPVRLQLQQLSVFETKQLLQEALDRRPLPAEFTQDVHQKTGGNPLYILELLRSLRDTDQLQAATSAQVEQLPVPMPDNLRTLIGSRLQMLDGAARQVAAAAAVVGSTTAEVLADTAGLSSGEAAAASADLVAKNLLFADGHSVALVHDATRQVALSQLAADDVAQLHVRAADALVAHDFGTPEQLTSHLLASGQLRQAFPQLLAAADNALQLHAYHTAVTHLEAAWDVSNRIVVDTEILLQLLLDLEAALDVLGRRDVQGRVLDELEQFDLDTELQLQVTLRRTRWLAHTGNERAAVQLAQDQVDGVAAEPAELRAAAMTTLGTTLHWAGDPLGAVKVLQQALDLTENPTHTLLSELGQVLRTVQRFDEAVRHLSAAAAAAEEADDEAGLVLARGGLANVFGELGQYPQAIEQYRETIALARRIGYRHRQAVSSCNLGVALFADLRIGEALDVSSEALELFNEAGHGRGRAHAQLNRGWLLHRGFGRDEQAAADLNAALGYFAGLGSTGLAAATRESLAGIARRHGNFERAEELLAEALAGAQQAQERRAEAQVWRGIFELALARDDVAVVLDAADDAIGLAVSLGMSEFTALLAALAAAAAVRAGDESSCLRFTEVAQQHLDASGEPHRVHHLLGQAAAGLGDEEAAVFHRLAAVEVLQQALDTLDEETRADVLERVPTHAAIMEAAAPHLPQQVTVELAREDAGRGRALDDAEMISVVVQVPPAIGSPSERRQALLDVVEQVAAAGAAATVADLSELLDVAASTVRRDLKVLRDEGHEVSTRGRRTS